MKNRLFRLASQGSGMAFAAMAVALISFHNQVSLGQGADPARATKAAADKASPAIGTTSAINRVGFSPSMSRIFHD